MITVIGRAEEIDETVNSFVDQRIARVCIFSVYRFVCALFGIAGIVYGTEVSKRCQQRINDRFAEIEIKMFRRNKDHEEIIKKAVLSLRNMMEKLEETELSQSRDFKIDQTSRERF